MIFGLLMRQLTDGFGVPVKQRNVVESGILRLVSESDYFSAVRPKRTLFADVWRVGQVDDGAAVTRDGVEVPHFISGAVLLKEDPLAVRRPRGCVLPVIRLSKLHRPAACSVDFPDVRAPGQVGCESNFPAIRRPRRTRGLPGVVKIIDRNRMRSAVRRGSDCFRISDGTIIRRGRSGKGKRTQ